LVTTESFITIVSGNHSSGVFLSFCKDFAAPHPRPGARTQYQPCEPRRAEGCEKGVWLSRSGGWLRPRRSVSCCSAPQAAGPPGSQGAPPPPTRDPTVRGGGGSAAFGRSRCRVGIVHNPLPPSSIRLCPWNLFPWNTLHGSLSATTGSTKEQNPMMGVSRGSSIHQISRRVDG